MAARIIEALAHDVAFDVAFVWLAPYSLQEQAARRLGTLLKAPAQKLTERDELAIAKALERNEVALLNWASVNRDEGKIRSGKEGRKALKAICGATRREDGGRRQIVLVIDESHHSRKTLKAEEVIAEIDPDAILEITATPDAVVHSQRSDYEVPRSEVVTAQLIKKRTRANDGLPVGGKRPPTAKQLDGLLLDLAIKKRRELADAFAAEGSDVNPLLLIQIPDGEAGDATYAWLIKELAKPRLGITYANGRLARWLSEDKTYAPDDPKLLGNDGSVEALIFKQAIALGWDCPRAHVLLKLRDPAKKEAFEVQTLGRIMRMPERKHYANELLNQAYVYHPHSDYKPGEDMAIVTASARWKSALPRPEMRIEWLKSGDKPFLSPQDASGIAATLAVALGIAPDKPAQANRKHLEKAGYDLNKSVEQVLSTGTFTGEDARDLDALGKHKMSVGVSTGFIERVFDSLIGHWVGTAANPGLLSEELYDLLMQILGFKSAGEVQTFVVANRDLLEGVARQAVDTISPRADRNKRLRASGTWTPSASREYNAAVGDQTLHEPVDADYYGYEPCLLGTKRTQPERAFEEWLEDAGAQGKIAWWVKNGESPGTDPSFVYEAPSGIERNFFPDYTVLFTDGTLALFETKQFTEAFTTEEKKLTNAAKMQALKDWVDAAPAGSERDGGFIVQFNATTLRYALDGPPKGLSAPRLTVLLNRH